MNNGDFFYLVYMITREDGKRYIGTTNTQRLKQRMSQHRSSKRFKGMSFSYEILAFLLDENVCLSLEEEYIQIYNTYLHGLNTTEEGKGYNHNSKNFTTKNYQFTEQQRTNMKIAWGERKKRGLITRGYKHTEETKRNWSKKRKGRRSSSKLTTEQVREIKKLHIENTHIDGVGTIQRNGKPMSYTQAFAKKYGTEFNITPANIKHIITGVHWSDVQV